jgi:putative transcriptional regulator
MAIRLRLRELLKQHGMSQVELQARTGLGYSSINAMYHNKTQRIEFATLDVLCMAFRCQVSDILERTPVRRRTART